VHYENKKTNPNVNIRGGDENYLQVNGYSVEAGRNFNLLDVQTGRNVCELGSDVAAKLFGENRKDKAVDKMVRVGGIPYRVIGVLKSKGSSAMMRADNIIVTTYNNVRRTGNSSTSYTIGVLTDNVQQLDGAVSSATATFRAVRKLLPTESDNFCN